jgi:hypothetical protein
VAPFILTLLFISAVAFVVVAAFALPHVQAGSRLLTPQGERAARTIHRRLHRVTGPVVNRLNTLRARLEGQQADAHRSDHGVDGLLTRPGTGRGLRGGTGTARPTRWEGAPGSSSEPSLRGVPIGLAVRRAVIRRAMVQRTTTPARPGRRPASSVGHR